MSWSPSLPPSKAWNPPSCRPTSSGTPTASTGPTGERSTNGERRRNAGAAPLALRAKSARRDREIPKGGPPPGIEAARARQGWGPRDPALPSVKRVAGRSPAGSRASQRGAVVVSWSPMTRKCLLFLALAAIPVSAQVNAGEQKPEPTQPFVMTQVASFRLPWRITFLPDGRMLVTEKVGGLWLVTPTGEKTAVANIPAVAYGGQNGMLGVFLSPHYAKDHNVYLTYSEPGEGGSGLALARGQLAIKDGSASLEGLEVLWHQMPKGRGGQEGAQIAFSPDGKYLFLTVGDRQRMTPAQDPNQELGKLLRLTLDGKPAP